MAKNHKSKELVFFLLIQLIAACKIGKDDCTCYLNNNILQMQCSQTNYEISRIDFTELFYDNYNAKMTIQLEIFNKHNFEIISSASNISLSITSLALTTNELKQLKKIHSLV